MWNDIRRTWCVWMHSDTTLPVHGQYRCLRCGLVFRVPWAEEQPGDIPGANETASHVGAHRTAAGFGETTVRQLIAYTSSLLGIDKGNGGARLN
jgi:hypothetical protein